jgi:tetratricopeptide (TPR) repeat protein
MAFVKASYGRDPVGAEQSYRRAIELGPNSSVAHLRYATFLLRMLRLDEAIRNMRRAQELDPLSPNVNLLLGSYYGYAGQYEEAIKYSRIALELEPGLIEARFNLAEVYGLHGMCEEAIAEFGKLVGKEKSDYYGKMGLAYVYAELGRKAEARQLLSEVEGQFKAGKAPSDTPFQLSMAYVAMGQKEDAFAWLEKALGARVATRFELRYNRKLNPLKSDPRFEQMLSQHDYTKLFASELSKPVLVSAGAGGG